MRPFLLALGCYLGLTLTGGVRAAEAPAVVVAAEAGAEHAAALIEAALSTSTSRLQVLERVALSSLLAERELTAAAITAKVPAAALVVVVESIRVEKQDLLVARLVTAQTSAVLGIEVTTSATAKTLEPWSQRVAEMVNARAGLAARPISGLIPVSLINFRRAFEAGALNQLTAEPHACRLLASRLQALPGCLVLDRASLSTLQLEKELSPISEAWWRTGWMIDGTYQPKGGHFEASLTLRRQQGSAQMVTVVAEKPGLAALAEAVATTLAGKLAMPPGEPVNPEVEAYAYGREAEWLWDIGLRAPAVTAARAARELGSRHRAAVSVPAMSAWFDAWPNMLRATYDKDNPARIVLVWRDFVGGEREILPEFITTAESTFAIHPEQGRDLRPTPAQMTAVSRALEELVNDLARRPAPTADGWSRDMQRSLWRMTVALGAHLLDIDYAHPAGDAAQQSAAHALRQSMRDAISKLATERPWYLSHLPPVKPLLAETLDESIAALEGWPWVKFESQDARMSSSVRKQIRFDTNHWANSHTHWSTDIDFPPLAAEIWRPALYDWQRRDRDRAAVAQSALFKRLISDPDPLRHADGAILHLIWNHNPQELERALSAFLTHLTTATIPASELVGLVAGLLNLEVTGPMTEPALEAGRTQLLDQWVALVTRMCNLGEGVGLIEGQNIARFWAKRPDREKWAAPLFSVMLRTAQQRGDKRLSDPAALAQALHHELGVAKVPAPGAVAVANKVVPLTRWWPARAATRDTQVRLEAADLDGDAVYVLPAWFRNQSIELIKLEAATMKELQRWKLPLRAGKDVWPWDTHLSLRVVTGVAHIGIGARMLSLNLTTGKVDANYASEELTKLHSVWNDGRWYGWTSERAQLGGQLIAEVDAAAGKHRMLADTLRNPPLHALDGSSGGAWTRAWPLVPIGPGKLLASVWKGGWFLFDLKTGQPSPWLTSGSGAITDLDSNGLYNSRMKPSGSWTTLVGMARTGDWTYQWNVLAFDPASGRRWTLLWGGTRPLQAITPAVEDAPKFDQPPDPGYRQGGGSVGHAVFDGRHLALLSRYCDRSLKLRLHLWQTGERSARTVLLDTPVSSPLWDEEGVRRFHGGLELVGGQPRVTEGKVQVRDLWGGPAGIVFRCGGYNSPSESLTFLRWQELGL